LIINYLHTKTISFIKKQTELSLHSNQIQNLKPLAALTQLTTLNLSQNPIKNIAPLANLKQLKSVSLQGNKIKDLTPLTTLKNFSQHRLEPFPVFSTFQPIIMNDLTQSLHF
jgi:Leucine-rich repeat (LRR) protein